jgi:hypothetical protein
MTCALSRFGLSFSLSGKRLMAGGIGLCCVRLRALVRPDETLEEEEEDEGGAGIVVLDFGVADGTRGFMEKTEPSLAPSPAPERFIWESWAAAYELRRLPKTGDEDNMLSLNDLGEEERVLFVE